MTNPAVDSHEPRYIVSDVRPYAAIAAVIGHAIDRAELQLAFAQKLLESAEAMRQGERTPLPNDEANGAEAHDVSMSDD